MANFCGKCGSRLDAKTGLCPQCDVKKIKKKMKKNKKHNGISVFIKCIGWIFVSALLLVGLIAVLTCFKIIQFPMMEKVMNQFLPNEIAKDVEKDIPDTTIQGFTYYQSAEENIACDSETGIEYVNNEILITLESEEYRVQLEEYLKTIGGTIVGEITELADYQVLLKETYSFAEIQDMIDELNTFEWVSFVSPNYAMEFDEEYIPNDEKWLDKWGDAPEGSNWGLEAIDAPEAWEYRDKMTTVNVGIFDSMFDENHEDLKFAENPWGNDIARSAVINGDLKWCHHGTHVAGTMAATFDNKIGITGIPIKTNLYGVSIRGLETSKHSSSQAYKLAFYYLIAEKKCAVVNISLGTDDSYIFSASRDCKEAIEYLKEKSQVIEKFLKKLIEKNYQYVICVACGNGNGYHYFKADEDDTVNTISYLSYEDYLQYLDGKYEGWIDFSRYKRRKKEIQGRLCSGNVDAGLDILSAISDENVKQRIIVVGAVKNKETAVEGNLGRLQGKEHAGYEVAYFSQCGKRVDVVAPGVDIYSSVKGGYGKLDGTSMASPHVAGVAALIFSVRPDIQADKVKDIIRESAVGSYGKEGYGLVNAANAVEMALEFADVDEKAEQIPEETDEETAEKIEEISETKLVKKCVTWYNTEGVQESKTEFTYDTYGNMIKKSYYKGDVYIESEYEYNNEGKKIKGVDYIISDGGVRNFTYDEYGNESYFILYDEESVIVEGQWTYEYNENGNPIKGDMYDGNGVLLEKFTFEYDTEGNVILYTNWNQNGKLNYMIEDEFDSRGIVTKETQYWGENTASLQDQCHIRTQGKDENTYIYTVYDMGGEVMSWYEVEYMEIGVFSENEESTILKEDYQQAYIEFAQNYVTVWSESDAPMVYKLAYIDADEVPELLIIGNDCHACGPEIFTYREGEVKPVLNENEYNSYGSNGSMSYAEKTGLFYGYFSGMDGTYYTFYEMCGDRAEKRKSIVMERDMTTDSYVKYYVDDIMVNEKTCNSELEEVLNTVDYQAIGYSENGIDITDLVLGYKE